MGNPAAEQSSLQSPNGPIPTAGGSAVSPSSAGSAPSAGVVNLTDHRSTAISSSALGLVWLSAFAVVNLGVFHLLTRFVPAFAEAFKGGGAALARVEGGLEIALAAVLLLGWGWFDFPATWRSLSGAALSMPFMRFLAIVAGGVGAVALGLQGLSGGELSLTALLLFPVLSALFASHAYLCAWASRLVARHTGVRLHERVGLVNLAPRHGPVGSTEVHDKMVRLAELQCGDLIRLKRGQIVPCDAIVESGVAELSERRFSGFAELRFKGEGQRVYAGSEVRSGEVLARVESLFPDAVITNFTEVLDGVVRRNLVPERWESLAHALVLFAAACAGIYFYRDGAGAVTVAGVVAAVLAAAPWVDLLAYLPLVRGVAVTRAFERGILCGEPHHLDTVGRIKSLVLDHAPGHKPDRMQVADFTVFDERLDSEQLISALLSILGRSNDTFGVAAVEFLRERVTAPMLHDVRDLVEYPGKGFSAVVAGAEFSIGSEMFLIERGVQIQISEVEEGNEGEFIYVALGEEVAARFAVQGALRHESPLALDRLHRCGVRSLLMSQAPREVVDEAGKEMTLELAQITGGLSVEQYVDRLKNVAPALLACTPVTPHEVSRAAAARIMHFDEVRFHLDPKAITVFRLGVSPIVEVYELGRRLVRALSFGRWGGLAMVGITVVVGLASGNPLIGVALALLAPLYIAAVVRYTRGAGVTSGI